METVKKKKETDAIKERLNRYAGFQHLIGNQMKRLEALGNSIYSPSAPNIDGMPGSAPDGSRTEQRFVRCVELEERIRELVQEEADERRELEAILSRVTDADERTVIELRYFDHLDWWGVTDTLFGDKTDYEKNEKKYLRKAFRIHGSALQSMAKALK